MLTQEHRFTKRQQWNREHVKTPPSMAAFKSAKSFRIYEESDAISESGEQAEYDLLRLPLPIHHDETASDAGSRSSSMPAGQSRAKMNLACVELDSLDSDALGDAELANTAQRLSDIHDRTNLGGIALRYNTTRSPAQVIYLLEILYCKGVPALLLSGHDSDIWKHVNYSNVAGIIIENATILPNGQRRDYFQSHTLREIMARCSKEREGRPELFVGFLELWNDRPDPAVVRRSVKLAEHFGAVVEHGPVRTGGNGMATPDMAVKSASQTLSGFEYLRRSALIELQKSWSTESRKVWLPDETSSSSSAVACLPLKDLHTFIPGIAEQLSLKNLTPELEDIRGEQAPMLEPPSYMEDAPTRESFWDVSSQGQKFVTKGCFPISTEALPIHFDAVIKTQKHLQELQMLQPFKGAELHRLLDGYRYLTEDGESHELVYALIEGLESHQVRVFKGLDTGFGVPEGPNHFWGVSSARDDTSPLAVDIFISLKAPNDGATILHTWLAHHGLPRVHRFEIEYHFEVANGLGNEMITLPQSMQAAIERCSHAETLSLLQQVHASGLDHFFREPLTTLCRTTLIGDASKYSWYHTVSQKLLDGSMKMEDILQLRLEYFARNGAVRLPAIDSLVSLHESLQVIVQDALFFGNREPLNAMTDALLEAWDPETSGDDFEYVDINADLFAIIFFSILRKAAFENVYIEATDRCPFFLSQPDQAAVFSELWVLGSQCEIYFGILPRALGEIVYKRYRAFLSEDPPPSSARKNNEIMTMYSNGEPTDEPDDESGQGSRHQRDKLSSRMTGHEKIQVWKKRITELGAMSIFCLPAIMDVLLLTFVGRGVFMTAFMKPEHLQAAGLALLIALLLTAGVTGWVGSVGNYYLINYAYDNMIYFHVQRLSGGFVLTLVIAVAGLIGYAVEYGIEVGFVFAGYLIVIATYFNLLGVMATMHQSKSPITSGRTILWRTIPLLLVSPILSSFVNGHDLEIYLPVTYAFLFLALYQYRRLCHEWSGWMAKIPKLTEPEVLKWHKDNAPPTEAEGSEDQAKQTDKSAQEALRKAVESHQRGIKNRQNDDFVAKVANGMPYVDWLFKKTVPNGTIPELFTASWFTQLGESIKQQKQLSRGLKEHNVLLLFRFAKYDLGQNLGLFLVALMDRWVSITMGARLPRPSIYVDSRSRYGICLCILYFCASVMLLDATLQKYWETRFKLSEEKLTSHEHAKTISRMWERRRLRTFGKALKELLIKILVVFGACTILLWMLVDNPETIILYYCYVLGYTCVILFQFNRCFTTNVRAHITIILLSAAIGYVVGCTLRAVPATADWLYCEILAQNVAAVLAAGGTFLWTWKDWATPSPRDDNEVHEAAKEDIFWQSKLSTESSTKTSMLSSQTRGLRGTIVVCNDGSYVGKEVLALLQTSLQSPNAYSQGAPWSARVFQTAIALWTERKLSITVATRQHFVQHGLQDIWSFSQLKGSNLDVTVGYLSDEEVRNPSWQPLLASLCTEAVLYHVTRAEMRLSHAKAVQSEHFLQETSSISKRVDFELAFESEASLERIRRKTNVELMKHLCLDLSVDAEWESIPESVRESIINRISGGRIVASRELQQWTLDSGIDLLTVDFHLRLSLQIHQKVAERGQSIVPFGTGNKASRILPVAVLRPAKISRSRPPSSRLQHWLRAPVAIPLTFVKWVAIISGAGSDIERELWYCLKDFYFQRLALGFLLLIWRFCCFVKDLWIYTVLIYHRPSLVAITRLAQRGARRKLKGNAIIVELPRKTVTGFASLDDDGSMMLKVFDGILKEAPADKTPLFTASYDDEFRLKRRVDNGKITSTYNYPPSPRFKWPLSKEVSDDDFRTVGFYDKHGRVSRGTVSIGGNEFAFQYHYKATPKGSTDVLSGDFKLISSESDDVLSVFWGAPIGDNFADLDWVPSERICRLVKVIDGRTYITEAEYRHKRDPLITSFLVEENGRRTAIAKAPKVFKEESVFLARPNNLSFDLDDLLIYHNKLQIMQMKRYSRKKPSFFSYLNPMNWLAWWGKRVHLPIPTWRIRTELWSEWLKSDTIDAPTACWIDELVLREEPLLRDYWRARDGGRLHDAKEALDKNIDQITSAIDIQTDVSEVCLLPIRTSDLYTMGLGKDATQVTTRPEDCYNDTDERISVIFNDIGCWPEAPGGVSNCRRDLVNGHSTIRNHVLAECANDYGIPRFQVEKNVQSMKLLPLWGLDGKTAHHGLIDNLLQSQVDQKVHDTDVQRDIVGVFIPLLRDFVKGARTRRYSRAGLIQYSNTVLSMSKYYEHKDYIRTWESREVEKAWVDAWLVSYNDPNIVDPSECFELERPSMSDFREAMGIYLAYFFIFSVKIPDRCPRVFQSTHHGISSLFGMILRYRRGVTFGIWDHAILWRECCLNISPAQCELPISVQSMLLSGIGLATRLAYFHADVIMPCTSLFNP